VTQVLCDPIGTVVGGRGDVVDDDWRDVTSVIRLDGRFSPESLSGSTDSPTSRSCSSSIVYPWIGLKPARVTPAAALTGHILAFSPKAARTAPTALAPPGHR